MKKYKQNLRIQGAQVWSYTTHVATIDGNDLRQLGWWSVTTQKHINYVAAELNLNLIKWNTNPHNLSWIGRSPSLLIIWKQIAATTIWYAVSETYRCGRSSKWSPTAIGKSVRSKDTLAWKVVPPQSFKDLRILGTAIYKPSTPDHRLAEKSARFW